jgi:hypothetical protein
MRQSLSLTARLCASWKPQSMRSLVAFRWMAWFCWMIWFRRAFWPLVLAVFSPARAFWMAASEVW